MRKSKRTEEPSNQYLEVINNKYCYFGPDYKFTLTDEKYHNYATLVINPSHIKIVKNETSKSNQELKEQIVNDWFIEENESTRDRNNRKAREKGMGTKICISCGKARNTNKFSQNFKLKKR